MTRRSMNEIKLDILQALKEKPLLITHIFYKTRTNLMIAKKIVSTLIKKGLVTQIKDKKKTRYQLTMQGLDVLIQTKKLNKLLGAS